MTWATTSQDGISWGQQPTEGGLRPNRELGLTKRDRFNEMQGKMSWGGSPPTTGDSGRGLWRNGEGGGGTLRGGAHVGGRLEG